MRALSIRQPFATLIALGLKRFELRTWATPYRGEIAIHASSNVTRAGLDQLLKYELFRDALEMAEIDDPLALPQRAVVGTAILRDIHRARDLDSQELFDIDYLMCGGNVYEDDQLWRLEDPSELERPIPINGKLNLWTLPGREATRVKRAERLQPVMTTADWRKLARKGRRS